LEKSDEFIESRMRKVKAKRGCGRGRWGRGEAKKLQEPSAEGAQDNCG
jgi:hypothetical protein